MAGAQQVLFVNGPGLHAGHNVVGSVFLGQIQYIQLAGAGFDGLLLQTLQLIGLAHIAGNGNDLAVIVVFLQPRDNDGSIQAAGVGKNDFFNGILIHNNYLQGMNIIR